MSHWRQKDRWFDYPIIYNQITTRSIYRLKQANPQYPFLRNGKIYSQTCCKSNLPFNWVVSVVFAYVVLIRMCGVGAEPGAAFGIGKLLLLFFAVSIYISIWWHTTNGIWSIFICFDCSDIKRLLLVLSQWILIEFLVLLALRWLIWHANCKNLFHFHSLLIEAFKPFFFFTTHTHTTAKCNECETSASTWIKSIKVFTQECCCRVVLFVSIFVVVYYYVLNAQSYL